MQKMLWKTCGLIVVTAILAALLLVPANILAYRGTWAYYYGWVNLNHQNVPAGSTVTAWIDGCAAGPWSTSVFIANYHSQYGLEIPMDSGNGNGGRNGNLVHFRVIINGTSYFDPNLDTWQEGADIEHDMFLTTPVLAITSSSIPDGTVGVKYTDTTLTASGGTGALTWSDGGLPDGLAISNNGTISGTPTGTDVTGNATTFSPVFTVTDANHVQAQKTLSCHIFWITGDANGDGKVNSDDIWMVIKIYLGLEKPTPGADANHDGVVDIGDVVALERIIWGL